jgi:uncharacterized protein (TIGR03083 family)
MGERTAPILARLEEKGMETAAFFRSLDGAGWQAAVYSEGARWAVRDVLAHFVSAERAFLVIFQEVMRGGEGAPEGFDIDRFNQFEVANLASVPPDELVAQFEQARAATVDFVRGLADSDLDREGRHPFFGVDRLEKFLKLIYRHNMIHERDIRRALGEEESGG